ncbi:hypothetical protein PanWU01x14_025940, partial [Parasponia andersonii]
LNVLERKDVDDKDIINEVYQEEKANVLPLFHRTEKIVEQSYLVRRDAHPITLSDQLVVELNISQEDLNRFNNVEEEDFHDDGQPLVNEDDEFILSEGESNDSDDDDATT